MFLGLNAGRNNTGSGNIFIGHRSGESETGSNKLIIDNNHTSPPLIYGEFDNDILAINGKLGIGTSSPSHLLEVKKAINNSTLVNLENLGTSGANVLSISSNSTGTTDIVDIQNGAFIVQGNGKDWYRY